MSIIDRPIGHQAAATERPFTKGWYDDPLAVHRLRFHDGEDWTDHVTHYGPTPCQGCG